MGMNSHTCTGDWKDYVVLSFVFSRMQTLTKIYSTDNLQYVV